MELESTRVRALEKAAQIMAVDLVEPETKEFAGLSHDVAPAVLWDNIVTCNAYLSSYEELLGKARETQRRVKWVYELQFNLVLRYLSKPPGFDKWNVKAKESYALEANRDLFQTAVALQDLSGRIERIEGIRASYKALADAASRLVTVRQMDLELARTRRIEH